MRLNLSHEDLSLFAWVGPMNIYISPYWTKRQNTFSFFNIIKLYWEQSLLAWRYNSCFYFRVCVPKRLSFFLSTSTIQLALKSDTVTDLPKTCFIFYPVFCLMQNSQMLLGAESRIPFLQIKAHISGLEHSSTCLFFPSSFINFTLLSTQEK